MQPGQAITETTSEDKAMSLSTVLLASYLSYKLGAYNAKCPGQAWRWLRENSARVWVWMQTH